MLYRILADATAVFHFAFVLFVAFGALLVLRWRKLAWIHLPVAIWGALAAPSEVRLANVTPMSVPLGIPRT